MTKINPPTTPTPTLADPVTFANALFYHLYEDLALDAPLEVELAPFHARIERLEPLVAGHPEARQLVRELSDLCTNIAVAHHGTGLAFGAAAEQLRQLLRAGLSPEPPD